jgi:hypothetical protein
MQAAWSGSLALNVALLVGLGLSPAAYGQSVSAGRGDLPTMSRDCPPRLETGWMYRRSVSVAAAPVVVAPASISISTAADRAASSRSNGVPDPTSLLGIRIRTVTAGPLAGWEPEPAAHLPEADSVASAAASSGGRSEVMPQESLALPGDSSRGDRAVESPSDRPSPDELLPSESVPPIPVVPARPLLPLPDRPAPAPVTPAPVTPAPVTPAPVTPAPVTPAPVTPAPVTPAPVTPAPVTPAPVTPAPVTPAPVTPAPVAPAPVTPAPVTPAPVTPAPVTPAPVTPAPVTPAPVTPAPVTPAPVMPATEPPVQPPSSAGAVGDGERTGIKQDSADEPPENWRELFGR